MYYLSTRGRDKGKQASEAIAVGLAADGGLYVPESIPALQQGWSTELTAMPYRERAAYVVGIFLSEFSKTELQQYTTAAYTSRNSKSNSSSSSNSYNSSSKNNNDNNSNSGGNRSSAFNSAFDDPAIAPLHKLDNGTFYLELWHGPTCAFKDMALQLHPHLLTASLKKNGDTRDVCILVATSGDTGKAALEGFRDIPGIKIMVFYPRDGVSDVQKLQMTSQEGSNVNVVAVNGNFDHAQTGVKEVFADSALAAELNSQGIMFSSANSINWGRLVPQIAYYVSSYCDLLSSGEIKQGEKINFCVPTGNFGNIMAAYYAEKIGLPIGKLICASNRNDVLTQFINTGVYDRVRPFYATASPSMDILVSSNLERLLFQLSGRDGTAVEGYMDALKGEGRYEISGALRDELGRLFAGGMCSEEDTMQTIAAIHNKHGYLIDTHTAVAAKVLEDYREKTGDNTRTVIVSTASPFKFPESVLKALGHPAEGDGNQLTSNLAAITGLNIPTPLSGLDGKTARFNECVDPEDMKSSIINFLKRM